MKQVLLLIIFILAGWFAKSETPADSLLTQLDKELLAETDYVDAHMVWINQLQARISQTTGNLPLHYQLFDSILDVYKSFNYDSAFHYIQKLQAIAYKLHNNQMIISAKIKLGFIFVSSGMFSEAFDTLNTIHSKQVSALLLPDYYAVMTVLNYNLADQQDRYYSPIYEQKACHYVDSILMFANPQSYTYQYYKGLRHIRQGEFTAGTELLDNLLLNGNLTLHQKAIIYSTLSDVYINRNDKDKAIELLIEAALCDIRSATRETAAIMNLASLLYQQGNIKRAYTYTKKSLDYANYYGARHRKIQVGNILPIVEEEKLNVVENQKQRLLVYSLVVTVLILIIIFFIVLTMRQMKKLRQAEKVILESNKHLKQTNDKLLEANKIKEEYIGYYFNINSDFLDKMENLKTSIDKDLDARKYDHVRFVISKLDLKKERAILYQSFDKAFLKLFPNFISEFNALFEEKDRVQLANNELLNTDLRIFALIRMGITENDKIANILEFSVNTIYTYKTKIKNKSIVPNEEFEKRIMEINLYRKENA